MGGEFRLFIGAVYHLDGSLKVSSERGKLSCVCHPKPSALVRSLCRMKALWFGVQGFVFSPQ